MLFAIDGEDGDDGKDAAIIEAAGGERVGIRVPQTPTGDQQLRVDRRTDVHHYHVLVPVYLQHTHTHTHRHTTAAPPAVVNYNRPSFLAVNEPRAGLSLTVRFVYRARLC